MSYAWEVTVEDVQNVFNSNGMHVTEQYAENVLNDLCLFRVAKAAMYGDDMDEQTKYAYAEIERQLKIQSRA